jgi:hypothetical protein
MPQLAALPIDERHRLRAVHVAAARVLGYLEADLDCNGPTALVAERPRLRQLSEDLRLALGLEPAK